MNHSHPRGQETNTDFVVGGVAVPKHEYVGIGDLFLDLRTPFPPPADDIHTICIPGEEASEGLLIVTVPSLLQAFLYLIRGGVKPRPCTVQKGSAYK